MPYNFFLRAKEEVNHSEFKKHGSTGRKNNKCSEHYCILVQANIPAQFGKFIQYTGVNSVHTALLNALYHMQFTLYNHIKIQMIY
jgi:hypothetical protein